jgi:iron-sulfur cluster repair protein YtfE (RIC family)
MKAKVAFHWIGSRNERVHGEGTTRDVSLAGAYILTATSPPLNTRVQMEIIFPALYTESSARIVAEMKVLRVDHEISGEPIGGFSAAGKGFSVRAVSKNSSSPPGIAGDRTEV